MQPVAYVGRATRACGTQAERLWPRANPRRSCARAGTQHGACTKRAAPREAGMPSHLLAPSLPSILVPPSLPGARLWDHGTAVVFSLRTIRMRTSSISDASTCRSPNSSSTARHRAMNNPMLGVAVSGVQCVESLKTLSMLCAMIPMIR